MIAGGGKGLDTINLNENFVSELASNGIVVGNYSNISYNIRAVFEAPVVLASVELMANTVIGSYTYFRNGRISALRSIGRYCSVGPGVLIGEGNHPTSWLSTHPFQYGGPASLPFWHETKDFEGQIDRPAAIVKTPPVIGNDVWIGANAVILRGVNIGDGAIVAGGAMVTKDVAPYEIVGGVPAKHIRFRFPKEIIDRLQQAQWWDYSVKSLHKLPFDKIQKCLDEIETRKENGEMQIAKKKRVIVERRRVSVLED